MTTNMLGSKTTDSKREEHIHEIIYFTSNGIWKKLITAFQNVIFYNILGEKHE